MYYLELSDKDFALFRSLVYEKCGINLHEGKKELVRARLGKRLRQTHFKKFSQYYKYLIEEDTGDELIEMLNAISTNLTSFFRESKHFDFLTEEALPSYASRLPSDRSRPLRVWSAGCSSGEEPYSIAIQLCEYLKSAATRDIHILATDISTKVLSTAVGGIYQEAQTGTISKELLRKYFQKGLGKWQGHYRIKAFVRNMVEFRRLNLMEPFSFHQPFDIIFCRNVMIYFDKKGQQTVIDKFYKHLVRGGYLFIGHSESLMSTKHRFKYVQPTIYLKNTD
ncbi:MAG: protein-glutamate O-methyltransferase CheR [Desulfobacterales bacterium]|nr:protein-glutamate O-methyltransferase CheR [Desulfobacterales bacterium]MDD4073319.1 protein-glutamate O-methyltransferase CheR [Desulfobacterales bacterium]MDD4391353.1 protein-glutamate O-methyltransferase CheR [Desulfobacterales bacterium]